MWYGPVVALVDGALGKSLRESLKRREGGGEGEERRGGEKKGLMGDVCYLLASSTVVKVTH